MAVCNHSKADSPQRVSGDLPANIYYNRSYNDTLNKLKKKPLNLYIFECA